MLRATEYRNFLLYRSDSLKKTLPVPYHHPLSFFAPNQTNQSADHGQESKRPSTPHPAVWPLKSDAVDAAAAARKGQKHLRTQFRFLLRRPSLFSREVAVVPTAESEMR